MDGPEDPKIAKAPTLYQKRLPDEGEKRVGDRPRKGAGGKEGVREKERVHGGGGWLHPGKKGKGGRRKKGELRNGGGEPCPKTKPPWISPRKGGKKKEGSVRGGANGDKGERERTGKKDQILFV